MKCSSVLHLPVLLVFVTGLSAQENPMEGAWVARMSGGGSRAFRFHFTGSDSFSGNAGGEVDFTNGKYEKGWFSFSGHESFYTGFVAVDHLDITEELHFTGYKAVRKSGSKPGPNPLDGEWTFVPPRIDLQFKVNDNKLEGNFIDAELIEARAKNAKGIEKYAGVPVTKPFLDGGVRGNEAWFRYTNRSNEPAQMMVRLVGDHLEITTDIRRNLIAVRRPPATAAATPASSSMAFASPALTLGNGKVAKYEALAAQAMAAVGRNDLEAAAKLCHTLEQNWDSEDVLRASSPETWQSIDRAMDGFIHLITRNAGEPLDAKSLQAAYQTYVAKLKRAN